jgi:hypothetical protein
MSAHTITTMSRRMRQRRRRALALAIGICAIAIPATASAATSGYSTTVANGGSEDSSQANSGSGYSSVTSIAPPASEPAGSSVDSGYSSLNAIAGPPADTPTVVSSSPANSGDGFDWASAMVGAGASLAFAALCGVALLTVRRRGPVTPSPSTS